MKTFQLRKGTITITPQSLLISNDGNDRKFNMQLITGVCSAIYFICMSYLNFKRYYSKHETDDLIFGMLGIMLMLIGGISTLISIYKYSRANEISISEIKKIKNSNWGQSTKLYLADNKIRSVELIGKDAKEFVDTLVENSSDLKRSRN